ncbi:LysR family transcriptional regulator [Aestuariibacter salexigens]|uniref:LysR family transcriptional regulator n=1 Tax=Aestuariibacter salexigens TaxID=226010 RepID=UPI00047DFDA6|nr:LysR family transcriptional regulator [Aestuariibacter salexigens]
MQNNALFTRLDLNLLKVFEALYQHRNMTRAADVMHLTPSAISHAARRLKDLLDTPLFERHGNMMLPTPACERLAPDILSALAHLRGAFQQWETFTAQTSRQRFVIAMPEALELIVLPPLMRTVHRQAPYVSLSSVRLDRNQEFRDLATGQITLALDVARPVSTPIHHQLLQKDHYCVMLRRHHPLMSGLTRQSYLDSTHVTVSHRAKGATVDELALRQLGIERTAQWRCQHYQAAVAIVMQSDALLTIPESIAGGLNNGELIQLPLPFEIPPIETHVYWHQHADEDPAHQWLRDKLVEIWPNPTPEL